MSPYPLRCTCPHGERNLGTLHGVRMGRGTVRLSTTPGCPQHDTCHGYTAENRKALRDEAWWKDPWCPIHGKHACPGEVVQHLRAPADGDSK